MTDWIKHAFIVKFNGVNPQIYSTYTDVLSRDVIFNLSQSLPLRGTPASSSAESQAEMPTRSYRPEKDAEDDDEEDALLSMSMFDLVESDLNDEGKGNAKGPSIEPSVEPASPVPVCRRMGFVTLPLCCLVGTVFKHTIARYQMDLETQWGLALLVVGFLVLVAFKIIVGLWLLIVTCNRVKGMDEQNLGEDVVDLLEVERYTLFSKRIPT
eukprot:TRINITY_DN10142_c0_g1_i4.p1 TRINITY_DN10142_c0_g1~~TRINITY_DN10142_c0_g1_i4.p1  ORF type:complete len:211 (-),score=49.04 TRINITY_DN10142_c0_g1_i4:174-806(-)